MSKIKATCRFFPPPPLIDSNIPFTCDPGQLNTSNTACCFLCTVEGDCACALSTPENWNQPTRTLRGWSIPMDHQGQVLSVKESCKAAAKFSPNSIQKAKGMPNLCLPWWFRWDNRHTYSYQKCLFTLLSNRAEVLKFSQL